MAFNLSVKWPISEGGDDNFHPVGKLYVRDEVGGVPTWKLVSQGSTNDSTWKAVYGFGWDPIVDSITLAETQNLTKTTPPPSAPTILAVDVVNYYTLRVRFTDTSNNEETFTIHRHTSGGFIATDANKVGTVTRNLSESLQTGVEVSYDDTTCDENTLYYYKVAAVNYGGSNVSGESSNTTPYAVPDPVDSVSASATAYNNVQVTITDNDNNATGYDIHRGTTSGFTPTTGNRIAYNYGALVYNDGTVSENTQYWYKVFARNPSGPSASAVSSNAVTTPQTVPNGINSLAAFALSHTTIRLMIGDMATNEDGFYIYRSTSSPVNTSGAPYATIGAHSSTGSFNWDDTGCSGNQTYYYRVRPFNTAGAASDGGYEASDTTPDAPPGTPSASASAINYYTIRVTATPGSGGTPTGYKFYRGLTANPTTLVHNQAGNIWDDDTRDESTTYHYRVKAYNEGGTQESTYSADTYATTPAGPIAAPTGLGWSKSDCDFITLTWTDNADNELGYRVYRKTVGGSYVMHQALIAGTESFEEYIGPGNTYVYKVSAYNSVDEQYTDEVMATADNYPSAPTAPTVSEPVQNPRANLVRVSGVSGQEVRRKWDENAYVTLGSGNPYDDTGGGSDSWLITLSTAPTPTEQSKSASSITLQWTNAGSPGANILVYRSTDGSSYSLYDTIGSSSTTYTDNSCSASTTYWYKLQYREQQADPFYYSTRITNTCGNSTWSTDSSPIYPMSYGTVGGAVAITTNAPSPVINSAYGTDISSPPSYWRGEVTFATGNYCESVRIEFREYDSLLIEQTSGWTLWTTMNTSPNTTGYASPRNTGENYYLQFRVVPFSGDGQTGTQGSPVATALFQCGGGGGA